jgi:hypothetical protein
LKLITGINLSNFFLDIALAIKGRVHIEELRAIELNIREKGDKHKKNDELELVLALF